MRKAHHFGFPLVSLAVCLGVHGLLFGAVVFEQTQLELNAEATDDIVTFLFPFVVQGKAVTFQPSTIPCGCAFAEPDRVLYKPGERGTFTVRMLVEDRVGKQDIEVVVKTDDPAKPEQVLKLTTVIPQVLLFNRKIAVWDRGTGSDPQQITCTISPGYAVTMFTAVSHHASVAATITKTADPQVFTVNLNLVDPTCRKPIKIVVTTDLPVKRQATATLWAVNRLP